MLRPTRRGPRPSIATSEAIPAPSRAKSRRGARARRRPSRPSPNPPTRGRPSPSARASANASSGRRAVAAGVLGGLIVAALCAGGGYYLFAPKMELVREDASRLAVLEAQAQSQGAALAGLDKRLAALEAANSGNTRAAAAATAAAQRLNAGHEGPARRPRRRARRNSRPFHANREAGVRR